MRRLAKEEGGMTMGLVVIMIVLIGVLGAGLLTFVRTDLTTVVEANQGQRAFEIADAGVAAAARQLAADSTFDHYDSNDTNNVQWASTKSGVTLSDLDGSVSTTDRARVRVLSSSAAGAGGQNAGAFDAGRRKCPEENDAASSEPLVNGFIGGRTTYKVISTGEYGSAKRRIEATFEKGGSGSGYDGFPMATFATGPIEVTSGVQIFCTSFFSLADLKSGEIFETTSSSGTPTLDGVDLFYGNWYNPPWNSIPRPIVPDNTGSNKTASVEAGLGLLGKIKYKANSDGKTRVQDRRIDYSGVKPENSPVSSNPLMSNNTWAQDSDSATVQPITGAAARISFPFDPRPGYQVDLSNGVDFPGDSGAEDSLEAEAVRQGHFKVVANGKDAFFKDRSGASTDGSEIPWSWLDDPTDVVYLRFDSPGGGKRAYYKDKPCKGFDPKIVGNPDCPKGTLVIENAGFSGSSNHGHEGIIVIRGNSGLPDTLKAESTNFQLKGFMNVDGGITLQTDNKVFPLDPNTLANYYPFRSLGGVAGAGGGAATPVLRGWRECDEDASVTNALAC